MLTSCKKGWTIYSDDQLAGPMDVHEFSHFRENGMKPKRWTVYADDLAHSMDIHGF